MKHSTTKPDERTPMEKAIEYFSSNPNGVYNVPTIYQILKRFMKQETEERQIMEETVREMEKRLLKLIEENDKLKKRLGIKPAQTGFPATNDSLFI